MGQHQRRMGKIMPFTTSFNSHHPNSFWCLGKLDTDMDEMYIKLTFRVWENAASYDADFPRIPNEEKLYYLTGAEYEAAIALQKALPAEYPVSAELLALAWQVAENKKDTLSPTAAEPDRQVSFFESAGNA